MEGKLEFLVSGEQIFMSYEDYCILNMLILYQQQGLIEVGADAVGN